MAVFPQGLTLRTVTGSVDPGTEVLFRIPITIVGPTDDLIYSKRDIRPNVDGLGDFSVDLPVTDDPQWTAFQYFVRMQLGNHITKGAMNVPTSAGSYDMSDLFISGQAPVIPAVDYLDSTDIGSRVAGLDSSGQVLDGNGDPVTGGGGGGAVASVNGHVGVVVLTASDVGADAAGAASTAQTAAQNFATNAVTVHEADTTSVHGIANTANLVLTSDGRLSDARTPTAHASTHGSAGSDPVTVAQSQVTGLTAALSGKQDADADLTAIAALAPANDDVVQRKAGVWTNSTPAQLKTDLALTKGDVGLGSVDNTSDASKPISTATQTALNAKADLVGGLVPTAQIPAYAISEVFTAADQTAMLALTAQRGDMAVRTDTGHRYILQTEPASTLGNWIDLGTAVDGVSSVNGQAGVVVLAKADVGLGNVDNTSDASKALAASQITSGTFAIARIPTGTTGTTVPFGNDARFSDSRTPTAHAASHASAGSDPITISESQVTNLTTDLAAKQPLDSDLTTIAGLTPTTDNIIQSVAGAWASRTPAQVKTALAITEADVASLTTDLAAKAPLASPAFTGTPSLPTGSTAVTQTQGDNSTKLATTAYADTLGATKAPLASPTFTGTPSLPTGTTAVTQTAGNSTTAVATTAFVTTADNLKAPLASPAFTGTPSLPTGTTGVTQTANNNSTALATTAYVDTMGALKAPLASPTFTGTPAAPTAAASTNTTQLATTAFVNSQRTGSRVYNVVLDYGADPTGVADSTTAFQNALNAAAPSTQGSATAISGAVFVPPGFYTVGPLTVPHRVQIFGAGRSSKLTFKAAAGSRANMFTNSQNYSSTNDAQSIQIRDLMLDGNRANNASTWQCAVVLINDTPSSNYEWVDGRHFVQGLLIQNFTGDGIVQQGRGGSIIANNQVFYVGGFGYNVDIDNYLVGNDAGAIGLDGFLMHGSNYLVGCKAWFCGDALTSSRYAGNNATAQTVTPPSGNSWDGGSLTGGYVFSLANGWGNGFAWRDPSGTGTTPAGNFNGGVGSGLSAQDCTGSGFWLEAGRITLNGIEADSNGNNGTSNGASNGTVVAAKAGVTLNWSYNCHITGTSWDRSANLAHQAAALAVLGSGTGCRVELGFEGTLTDGTNAMPALLASSDVTNNHVKMMCAGGGIAQPSFASSYTPDPFLAETHQMTLTGNITVNAPKMTGTLGGAGIYLVKGMMLRLMLTQDGTGGRTVTLNSVFRLNSKTFSTTASATTCIEFMWDGTNWQAIS